MDVLNAEKFVVRLFQTNIEKDKTFRIVIIIIVIFFSLPQTHLFVITY